MFGRQPARTAWSLLASATLDVAVVTLFLLLARVPHKPAAALAMDASTDQLVWLGEQGPDGGGGGGGNNMPRPPSRPVGVRPGPVEKLPSPSADLNSVPLAAPAPTLAAALQDLPGLRTQPGPLDLSLGPGDDGRAGAGKGGGSGPGDGVGLGRGSGGNTGGNVYQPGNGVTPPVPLVQPRPNYTTEALRARLQGSTRIRCVVQPSGVCTDIEIVRSLDTVFGLDQEAIKAVQKWRFKPGARFGQPVPVQITIDVEFTLR